MRQTLAIAVLILFAFAVGHLYAQEDKGNADLDKRIEKLVEDLGADDFDTRENATEELKKIGSTALPALEKATKDEDEERAARSESIIAAIKGKTTESDKPDAPLERFRKSDIKGSSVIISPDGVTISEKVFENGEWVTKEYKAKSIDEFKEKYPEIAKKYGVGEKIKIGKITPDRWRAPSDDDFEKELGELKKRMKGMLPREPLSPDDTDEYIERLRKEMQEKFGKFGKIHPLPQPLEPKGDRETEPAEPEKSTAVEDFGASVKPADAPLQKQLNLEEGEGIVITSVKTDSAADKVGLKEHDIVLNVNGEKVDSVWSFRRKIKDALSKEEIAITVLRSGKEQTLKANTNDLKETY